MTSEEFPVTCGVRQGCVLAPTLFNLYFDVAIRLALSEHEGKGVKFAYLHNTHLVGNRKILREESIVSDLEYTDDMALLSDNWEDLTAMLSSLAAHLQRLGTNHQLQENQILGCLTIRVQPVA